MVILKRTLILNKRIAVTLFTDGGNRAVAADERNIIIQRQKMGFDGIYQSIMIAILEICAPDGSFKQNITNQRQLYVFVNLNERTG